MNESERNQEVAKLVEVAKQNRNNGSAPMLNARIRQFEMRYEMSSDTMRQRLRAGEIRETAEIADWLFWLDVREGS
jgi:hypothetical protein